MPTVLSRFTSDIRLDFVIKDEDFILRHANLRRCFEPDFKTSSGANKEAGAAVTQLVSKLPCIEARISASEDTARHDRPHENDREEDVVAAKKKQAIARAETMSTQAGRDALRMKPISMLGQVFRCWVESINQRRLMGERMGRRGKEQARERYIRDVKRMTGLIRHDGCR